MKVLIVSAYLLQYVFQVQGGRGEQIHCCVESFLLPELGFGGTAKKVTD